jgi:polyhydroxyalkanoate synthesis regulator phasin
MKTLRQVIQHTKNLTQSTEAIERRQRDMLEVEKATKELGEKLERLQEHMVKASAPAPAAAEALGAKLEQLRARVDALEAQSKPAAAQ